MGKFRTSQRFLFWTQIQFAALKIENEMKSETVPVNWKISAIIVFTEDENCQIKIQHFLILTRICASLGLRMKFKTLFMSDHDLLLFFNMSNQFLAPGGLNADCVKVNVM